MMQVGAAITDPVRWNNSRSTNEVTKSNEFVFIETEQKLNVGEQELE